MGFLAASASVCYFQVTGTFPQADLQSYVLQQLNTEGFRSIEKSHEELAIGWVQLDDYDAGSFESAQSCWREQHLCFSLRQDRRKLPAALLKREVTRLSELFLTAHPTFNRVPKGERERLRDEARNLLLARTLPTPACYDVIWNMEQNLLRLCSLSQAVSDSFQGLFHQTFPDLRLHLLHPLARAKQLLSEPFQEKLQLANQAQTDSVLEQIEANRWLGYEFLQWLLYRTLNSDANYAVTTSGPLLASQPFRAFLDNRLVLVGGGAEGVQKVTVAGPQDQYSEARAALQQGKQIEEAILHLQQDEENSWKLTLKGERFQFGGFRTPMVRPEKDPNDDPLAEAVAAFYTKLGAVETGEQLFNSLLKDFLEVRLSNQWQKTSSAISRWLEE